MKKYLVTYKKYIDSHWKQFIEEADIQDFCWLLQGMINDDISDLFIQLKPLQPASEINKEAAKTLFTILSEEQNSILQKAFEEDFSKVDD